MNIPHSDDQPETLTRSASSHSMPIFYSRYTADPTLTRMQVAGTRVARRHPSWSPGSGADIYKCAHTLLRSPKTRPHPLSSTAIHPRRPVLYRRRSPCHTAAMPPARARNEPVGDDYANTYGRERGALRAVLTDLLSKCTVQLVSTYGHSLT